ncbi:hypothetical protein SNOUR_37770 [Streptomyces noursei ATCC 11455]|uniref:hypothetical protein n=1 Tax=Streptomyces noursei TaxID=1971 RepID=UPI00081D09A0|nr:hypothetical protein SNOUR_37770 [Streptomyces noursei ATCC 11455]
MGGILAGRESYSFVCLDCGYGWERSYEIRHTRDLAGKLRVEYYAHGVREPSPITGGKCPECEGRHIRILRPGRVAAAVLAASHGRDGHR